MNGVRNGSQNYYSEATELLTMVYLFEKHAVESQAESSAFCQFQSLK